MGPAMAGITSPGTISRSEACSAGPAQLTRHLQRRTARPGPQRPVLFCLAALRAHEMTTQSMHQRLCVAELIDTAPHRKDCRVSSK